MATQGVNLLLQYFPYLYHKWEKFHTFVIFKFLFCSVWEPLVYGKILNQGTVLEVVFTSSVGTGRSTKELQTPGCEEMIEVQVSINDKNGSIFANFKF